MDLTYVPRQPRLNLPGYFYHVMARGIERRTLFRSSSDRLDFLKRLGEGLARSGSRCFSWALMSNHLHLLIMSGVRGLASLMHPLLTGYAVTFNLKYRRVGHLFQNRYKAILCEEDPYFLELVRYITLQPVRAGMIKTPHELANYPWTSHQALLGGPGPTWMETQDVLARFGNTLPHARDQYMRFIQDGWNQGHRKDLEGGGLLRSVGGMTAALTLRRLKTPQQSDLRILGSGSFVEQVLKQAEQREELQTTLKPFEPIDTLAQATAEFNGISIEALQSGNRSRPVAQARALMIYAAQEGLGITGTTLGRWLGISTGSVSKAFQRGKKELSKDKFLAFLKGRKGSYVP